jgi:hypothetical protein
LIGFGIGEALQLSTSAISKSGELSDGALWFMAGTYCWSKP